MPWRPHDVHRNHQHLQSEDVDVLRVSCNPSISTTSAQGCIKIRAERIHIQPSFPAPLLCHFQQHPKVSIDDLQKQNQSIQNHFHNRLRFNYLPANLHFHTLHNPPYLPLHQKIKQTCKQHQFPCNISTNTHQHIPTSPIDFQTNAFPPISHHLSHCISNFN